MIRDKRVCLVSEKYDGISIYYRVTVMLFLSILYKAASLIVFLSILYKTASLIVIHYTLIVLKFVIYV